MSKSAFIRARVEPKLKEEAEQNFHALGLSVTQAITLFYKQVALQKAIPFAIKTPNNVTKKAIEESKNKSHKKSFDSLSKLLEDLND